MFDIGFLLGARLGRFLYMGCVQARGLEISWLCFCLVLCIWCSPLVLSKSHGVSCSSIAIIYSPFSLLLVVLNSPILPQELHS